MTPPTLGRDPGRRGPDGAAGRTHPARARQGTDRPDRPGRGLGWRRPRSASSRRPPTRGPGDAPPKGDPAGDLVHVIDARTIALAERPATDGRTATATSSRTPMLGLLFLIPGRGDTLRINGRGTTGLGRALLRRAGGQGSPARARDRGRDRRALPPLRQGVPALLAVEARRRGTRSQWWRGAPYSPRSWSVPRRRGRRAPCVLRPVVRREPLPHPRGLRWPGTGPGGWSAWSPGDEP